MVWPLKTPDNKVDPANANPDPPTTPEKTPAELIAEALAPLVESQKTFQTTLNDRLTALENNTKPREKPAPTKPDEPISVLDDENAAFAQRMTPLMIRQLEFEAGVTKDRIKREYETAGYGELWTQFGAEIDQIVDSTALVTGDGKVFRGDPQYIRNVVDMVFGRAARKGGMKFGGKDKGFFLESASSGTESTDQSTSDGLTESQRKVVTRMGVPLDQAKKVMAKLHFVA
jgi:hypothetical protein